MPVGADPAPPRPMRLGFAGTPEFAATILGRLLDAGCRPLVVYTQPDRPAGRGQRERPPPVKRLADEHGLPVRQPASLRGAEPAARLAELALDVLVVAAYGLILPPAFLATPRRGCINVHASLLPRWRGAAPVERAILAGDSETGVSIMQMERGLDTGPVYLQRRVAIGPDTDGPTLEAELAEQGAAALLECLARLDDLVPTPQPASGVTYAHKLTPADARIDWREPAAAVARRVRALTGRMPAFTHAGGVRVSVLAARAEPGSPDAEPGTVTRADKRAIRVACGDGELLIAKLRLSIGKGRPLTAAEAVSGYARLFASGRSLGDPPSGSSEAPAPTPQS